MGWINKLEGPRGVRYKVGYRDPNRRLRYKTFPRRRDAEAYLASIENSKNVGTYVDPKEGAVPLARYWDHYWRTSKPPAESTQDIYQRLARSYVLPQLGRRPLNTLRKSDIRSWMADLREAGVGEPTVNASHRVLRRVLSVACDEGKIPSNPASRLNVKKPATREIRPLELEQVRAIAAEVDDRYRALVLLLGFCGLRIGEASALRIRRLDMSRRRLEIVEAASEVAGRRIVKETKTGKPRVVTLPGFLVDELARHVDEYCDVSDSESLVFTAPGGGPVTQTNFRNRVFQPAAKRLNIKPIPRVHDLRHTAVSLALSAGASAKEIQELVGHSSIEVTMNVYAHLLQDSQDRLAERLDAAYRATGSDNRRLVAVPSGG